MREQPGLREQLDLPEQRDRQGVREQLEQQGRLALLEQLEQQERQGVWGQQERPAQREQLDRLHVLFFR